MAMKILLTGFEPFGGKDANSSERVVLALREQRFPGVDLHTAILPVDCERGPAALLRALRAVQPDVAICLGEAKGRMRISIERVAINLLDYPMADNAGRQIRDEPIVPDGPAAYFVTLPVRALLDTLLEARIPAELSLSAGAFLCNQASYVLLHELAERRIRCRAGFIHLPWLPEQAAGNPTPVPSLSLETMRQGLATATRMLARRSDEG